MAAIAVLISTLAGCGGTPEQSGAANNNEMSNQDVWAPLARYIGDREAEFKDIPLERATEREALAAFTAKLLRAALHYGPLDATVRSVEWFNDDDQFERACTEVVAAKRKVLQPAPRLRLLAKHAEAVRLGQNVSMR